MRLDRVGEAEKRARDGLERQQWESEQLTPEQFCAREARLRAHPWASGAIDCWFLADDDGATLSSCATYRMRALAGGVAGEAWAVTNVFTEPELRRRGLATQLMDRLLARARADGAVAAILFSDVGAPIYERSGFVARAAMNLGFTAATGDPAAGVDGLLREIALPAPPAGELVIWPTAAQLDWQLERTRSAGELFARPPLPWLGARAGAASIHWSIEWKDQRLIVLLLDAGDITAARALVESARRFAGALGLRDVRLWEQPWPFAATELGGTRAPRRHSLPMIAPLMPSLRAEAWTIIPRALWV